MLGGGLGGLGWLGGQGAVRGEALLEPQEDGAAGDAAILDGEQPKGAACSPAAKDVLTTRTTAITTTSPNTTAIGDHTGIAADHDGILDLYACDHG